MAPGSGGALKGGAAQESGISRHIIHGLEVVVDSGLSVTVSAGMAGAGIRTSSLRDSKTVLCAASKDNYIDYDVNGGTIGLTFETAGDQEPQVPLGTVRLAKVVAGASTITSVTDYRDFGAVKPRNISAVDIEGGANLLQTLKTGPEGSSLHQTRGRPRAEPSG